MSTIKKFEDLKIWQLARKLNQEIFRLIVSENMIKDYPLKDQINRASGSIMDNIAEGFERGGNKEFRQFLSISRASCAETKSQLYRANDRNYISPEVTHQLHEHIDVTMKMITGMSKYLNSSEMKGTKFREPDSQYQTDN